MAFESAGEAFIETFIADNDGGGGGEYETASLQALNAPEAADFRDPRSYLAYLKSVAEADMRVATQISDRIDAGGGETVSIGEVNELNYKNLIEDINRELDRAGGPRADKITELYTRLTEIRAVYA